MEPSHSKTSKARLYIISAICAVLCVGFAPVTAAESDNPPENSVVVFVGGGEEPGFSFSAELYGNTSYVAVGEFSKAMGADKIVSGGDSIAVSAPGLELYANAGESYILVNDTYIYIPDRVLTAGGDVIAPVRPLAEAFGASVMWSVAFRAVFITRDAEPFRPVKVSQDDLFWMARIIYAEACGESFEGKLAVGNVIMNRVRHPQFPNSVHGVIFDKRFGTIQFTPAATGAINNKPSKDCIAAAQIAIAGGADIVGESLYFASTTSSWAARNRPCFGGVGNHIFYL